MSEAIVTLDYIDGRSKVVECSLEELPTRIGLYLAERDVVTFTVTKKMALTKMSDRLKHRQGEER
ncbi:MAG: hypothetical protein GVY29_07620 [Spirochaetes bacterium]|nr:hypothetical protein [Spirochaetota bacterium]